MWTSSSCSVQPYQTGSWIFVIRPRDQVKNLNLLHFDQITGLKSLSIYLFLLAQLNLGLQMDRLPVQASQEALCSERERGRERERERESRLFKLCLNLPAGNSVTGVRLYKRCRNLPAGHCVTCSDAGC